MIIIGIEFLFGGIKKEINAKAILGGLFLVGIGASLSIHFVHEQLISGAAWITLMIIGAASQNKKETPNTHTLFRSSLISLVPWSILTYIAW